MARRSSWSSGLLFVCGWGCCWRRRGWGCCLRRCWCWSSRCGDRRWAGGCRWYRRRCRRNSCDWGCFRRGGFGNRRSRFAHWRWFGGRGGLGFSHHAHCGLGDGCQRRCRCGRWFGRYRCRAGSRRCNRWLGTRRCSHCRRGSRYWNNGRHSRCRGVDKRLNVDASGSRWRGLGVFAGLGFLVIGRDFFLRPAQQEGLFFTRPSGFGSGFRRFGFGLVARGRELGPDAGGGQRETRGQAQGQYRLTHSRFLHTCAGLAGAVVAGVR